MNNKFQDKICNLFSGVGIFNTINSKNEENKLLELVIEFLEDKLVEDIETNKFYVNNVHKYIHYLKNDDIDKLEREKRQLIVQNINIQNINIGNEKKIKKLKVEKYIALFNSFINIIKSLLEIFTSNKINNYSY